MDGRRNQAKQGGNWTSRGSQVEIRGVPFCIERTAQRERDQRETSPSSGGPKEVEHREGSESLARKQSLASHGKAFGIFKKVKGSHRKISGCGESIWPEVFRGS